MAPLTRSSVIAALLLVLIVPLLVAQELPPPKPKPKPKAKRPPASSTRPAEKKEPEKQPAPATPPKQDGKQAAPSPSLLIMTNAPCQLVVDGEGVGSVTPNESMKVDVPLGDHVITCQAGEVTQERRFEGPCENSEGKKVEGPCMVEKAVQKLVRFEFQTAVERPALSTMTGVWTTASPPWELRLDQRGTRLSGTLTITRGDGRTSQSIDGRRKANGDYELIASPVMERRNGVLVSAPLLTLTVKLIDRGYQLGCSVEDQGSRYPVALTRLP